MSEPSEQEAEQEGWDAPLRLPLLATGGILALLLIGLVLAGRLYDARIRPATVVPPTAFPAPRLETVQTPPRERRPDFRQRMPARIGAAMRATAAEGDALWGPARP